MTDRDERLEAVVNTLLRLGSTFDDIFPTWSHRQVAQVICASYDAIRAFDDQRKRVTPTPLDPLGDGSMRGPDEPVGADPPWIDEMARRTVREINKQFPGYPITEPVVRAILAFAAGLMPFSRLEG